ncbi:hypothetical protein F5Y05DRAFT_395577 [Hypoxylon sp. FL0543]|nr:hypothetical protein F5Y05DRAFT_395577 [Hypoxylon sp. FL0543]
MKVVNAAIIRTTAVAATTIDPVYCYRRRRVFTPADPHGSYVGNMLLTMGIVKGNRTETSLQRPWILNAGHGVLNSAAAFLYAASTLVDPLTCVILVSGLFTGPSVLPSHPKSTAGSSYSLWTS